MTKQEHPEDSVVPRAGRKPVSPVPGYDVDRIDVAAGLDALFKCGYDDPKTTMVIEHSLMLWARGEEASAERKAIDRSFHGIDLTSWTRVLAAAMAEGERKAATGHNHLTRDIKPPGLCPACDAYHQRSGVELWPVSPGTAAGQLIELLSGEHPWIPGAVFIAHPHLAKTLARVVKDNAGTINDPKED